MRQDLTAKVSAGPRVPFRITRDRMWRNKSDPWAATIQVACNPDALIRMRLL